MILHAEIRGRVQGVGFRYWVVEEAERLGLKGWVRNQRDGSVELEAEGPEEKLFEFEKLLWQGPPLARVTDVQSRFHDIEKNYSSFKIVH
jgi:acylphosphatase